MGGIQAREGSLAEVHAVRGGQLILRVASAQTNSNNGNNGSNSSTSNNNTNSYSRSSLKIVIPYEGRCYILKQSMDVLEKIFYRLTPRELALLSLTCRTMNLIVSQFLEHMCSSYNMRAKLRTFYSCNADLLLPKEIVLKDRLDCNSKHELLLYSAHHQFIGDVRRVSLCDVDQFDHLTKPDHVVKERDVALKRNVVVLKKVCWLYFRHSFPDVTPGEYVIQLRLRLSNARWERLQLSEEGNNNWQAPAVVKISQHTPRGQRDLVKQRVEPTWWSKIEIHQIHSDLEFASFIFDRDSDWLFMKLAPFKVTCEDMKSTTVEFEFDDTKNPNWKHGLIWDFIELRSVVKPPSLFI